MYSITNWLDHAVTPARTFKITDNGDGTYTLTPAGEVIQQGTPMSAANFNNMETGIHAANIAAITAMNAARLAMEKTDSKAVIKDVNLTNTLKYPFNDSKTTVALSGAEERHNTDYVVLVEITNTFGSTNTEKGNFSIKTAGLAGNIVVTDKMTNGFKVEFTGGAEEVELRIYIMGGM